MAYIALIAVYIVVPHSLDTLRRTLSITALAFLALILVKSIDFLRQS